MRKHYLTHASAVVLVVLGLAGCSWRLETPPPAWPSPDPPTQVRDAAAERENQVTDAVHEPDTAGTPSEVVLSEIEGELSRVRLDAFGGLYVAYPDATPSPTADEQAPSLTDAVRSARDAHLADAFTTEEDDLALLLASAGLSHALSGWYAGWVEDAIGAANEPVVTERHLPSDAVPGEPSMLPANASALSETVANLALMHDQARYTYEVMAARAVEDEREQWLARRDIQAARAQALVGLPGVSDLREATYIVLGKQTEDATVRMETGRQVEISAGATYLALLAEAGVDQWPWLLHAAFDAYAQAAAYGEPTAADYPVPALPGIDVS